MLPVERACIVTVDKGGDGRDSGGGDGDGDGNGDGDDDGCANLIDHSWELDDRSGHGAAGVVPSCPSVVWVRSLRPGTGSVRRRRAAEGATTKRGDVDPKTNGSLR